MIGRIIFARLTFFLPGCSLPGLASCNMAVPGCIIDLDPRLHIVDEHMEGNTLPVVFYRICFHFYSATYQVISLKDRGDTV